MLKHEIKNILIKFLIDEKILDPSALSSVLVAQNDHQKAVMSFKLENFVFAPSMEMLNLPKRLIR